MEAGYLEPGESDQLYFNTYRVPVDIGTIQVEMHVPGEGNAEWETNSLFDVKPGTRAYAVTDSSGKNQ
jgi:hypothetical protein